MIDGGLPHRTRHGAVSGADVVRPAAGLQFLMPGFLHGVLDFNVNRMVLHRHHLLAGRGRSGLPLVGMASPSRPSRFPPYGVKITLLTSSPPVKVTGTIKEPP